MIMFSCGQIYIDIQLFSSIFHIQQNSTFKAIRQVRRVIRFETLRQSVTQKSKCIVTIFVMPVSKLSHMLSRANICLWELEWVKTAGLNDHKAVSCNL